jgi:hypothetical protein
MKRYILLSTILLTTIIFAQQNQTNPQITSEEIKEHIKFLASDELKGRFSGSPEEKIAGDYIKRDFEINGLKPAFYGSYFQEFPFIEKIELTDNNSFVLEVNGEKNILDLYRDFITMPFSGKGKFNGELIFAGYGISAPKLNYDDYEGIDVTGKIVVVMRYHPEHDSSKSNFDRLSSFRQKAITAKEKGASGIIFVNGFRPKNEDDNLTSLRYDGASGMQDFSVFHIKREYIDQMCKSNGLDLAELQNKIDSSKKPSSFIFKNANVSCETETREIEKTARNVGAVLEGNDPILKNEYIVIGAHYDHLGIDQAMGSSMYKGTDKQIHNGADDNASGTAGVIELAEKFSSIKDKIKRSIIFLAFSGEELGILGSTYYVNNPSVPIENIAAMLNMDMIGRLNEENELTIIGAGTSSQWKKLINDKNIYGFKLALSDGGSGGSDHQSFSNKNIPVMFFFTGTHTDYHKPSDDWDKINFNGQENVTNYVFDIAYEIDQFEKRPDYVKVEEPTNRGAPRSRVTVGTVPEFGYSGSGYKLSGVTEGGPGAKAGMKAGDIIIKFGQKSVNNIYDFMYAMGDYKSGDKVDVVVLRDGKEVTLYVELETK